MSRSLGQDEGFKRERAKVNERCPCGRGIPACQWCYRRADGALRCVHCQLRARHSTMTEEESTEMLERIHELLSEPTEPEAQKGGEG